MWHVTCDMLHVTHDRMGEVNLLLKCQLPSSYGLRVKVCWINELKWVTEMFVEQPRLHRVCLLGTCEIHFYKLCSALYCTLSYFLNNTQEGIVRNSYLFIVRPCLTNLITKDEANVSKLSFEHQLSGFVSLCNKKLKPRFSDSLSSFLWCCICFKIRRRVMF